MKSVKKSNDIYKKMADQTNTDLEEEIGESQSKISMLEGEIDKLGEEFNSNQDMVEILEECRESNIPNPNDLED